MPARKAPLVRASVYANQGVAVVGLDGKLWVPARSNGSWRWQRFTGRAPAPRVRVVVPAPAPVPVLVPRHVTVYRAPRVIVRPAYDAYREAALEHAALERAARRAAVLRAREAAHHLRRNIEDEVRYAARQAREEERRAARLRSQDREQYRLRSRDRDEYRQGILPRDLRGQVSGGRVLVARPRDINAVPGGTVDRGVGPSAPGSFGLY